ncbi:unnamed protein product [Alopecurus aequalis]
MATQRHGGDRLSALPDKALEQILSRLASDEAARASVLSRRWRHVSDAVPVVDLVDRKIRRPWCGRRSTPVCFDQQVASAVLSRDAGTPIRVFRLRALHPPAVLLDQWIVIASTSGAEEIDVELQGSYTKTPRQLFRCDTLRRLCLTNWTLDLPCGVLIAASLETLCLKRIMAPGAALQQLVASCPNLADLTLEECPGVTEITGLRPDDLQFLDVPSYEEVAALTIDICDDLTCKGSHEVAPVMELINRCKNLTYLHLALRPSMTCYSTEFAAIIRGLPELRQLVLKGLMATDHAIQSVALLIVNIGHLEVLSLIPLGLKRPKSKEGNYANGEDYQDDYDEDDDYEDEDCDDGDNYDDSGDGDYYETLRNMWRMGIPCLSHSLKRINIAKYNGSGLDRILAYFLLSKGTTLQEFSVTLSAQLSPHKEDIAVEFRSWRCNPSATVTCK